MGLTFGPGTDKGLEGAASLALLPLVLHEKDLDGDAWDESDLGGAAIPGGGGCFGLTSEVMKTHTR